MIKKYKVSTNVYNYIDHIDSYMIYVINKHVNYELRCFKQFKDDDIITNMVMEQFHSFYKKTVNHYGDGTRKMMIYYPRFIPVSSKKEVCSLSKYVASLTSMQSNCMSCQAPILVNIHSLEAKSNKLKTKINSICIRCLNRKNKINSYEFNKWCNSMYQQRRERQEIILRTTIIKNSELYGIKPNSFLRALIP